MIAELISIKGQQGFYPPRLEFTIRIKNDDYSIWYVFAYKGELELKGKNRLILGESEISFRRFELSPKSEEEIYVIFEFDYKKLDVIENNRKGDLDLGLRLNMLGAYSTPTEAGDEPLDLGRGLLEKTVPVISPSSKNMVIPQSKWVEILERLGYRKFKVMEIPIPEIPSEETLNRAMEFFEEANKKFSEGKNYDVLGDCRNTINELLKVIKMHESDLKTLLGDTLFERAKNCMDKFKLFLDLGEHKEIPVDKVRKIDREEAELALYFSLTLLKYFSEKIAELRS